MSAINLPPRQKMINMMYLVLTAILALNVSKEVLDAFATLDADLVRSERSHLERSESEYAALAKDASDFPDRFASPLAKARSVHTAADSLINSIDAIKAAVISKAEDLPLDHVIAKDADGRDSLLALACVEMKDDRDILTQMLVGSEPATPKDGEGTAKDLKRRISEFRDRMKGMVGARDPQLTASLDLLFTLEGAKDASGTKNNWESLNFYDVPLAAGIASLTKLQADIRSAETDLVKWLRRDADRDSYTMSTLTAAVIPQSSVVMLGDTFRADVFMAAFDDKNKATIDRKVDDRNETVPMGTDAKGKLRLRADQVGQHTVEGTIHFQGPNGPEDHAYSAQYQVMAPLLVASPTKMNVLYRGVDNPIEFSVPGVPSENVRPVIDNGSVVHSANGWVARVNTVGLARLTAVTTLPDGAVRSIGPVEFRVKDLPAPTAYMGGKSAKDATIKLAELKAAQGVIVHLENTDFDAPFKVTSFTFAVLRGGQFVPQLVHGNAFSEDVKAAVKAVRDGDRVYIEDIKARLVSGAGPEYTLSSLSLKVIR